MLATTVIAVAVLANALALAGDNVPRKTRPSVRSGLPPVPVVVEPSRSVHRRVVRGALLEASAIWEAAGVTFEWNVANPDDGNVSDIDDDCVLHVRITDEVSGAEAGRRAIGWITFSAPDSPQRVIHLSRAGVMELLAGTPGVREMPLLSEDALMARALGRALAHELGHYFLGPAHTDRGLMQGRRRAQDFFSAVRRGFEFTPEQVEAIARRVRMTPPS
jgi:hypothetical protein